MRLDNELQQDVLDELRDDPSVDACQVGVTADNGVVTLTGAVCSGGEKRAAERAAKRVYGTRAVANEIEVRLPFGGGRTDADVARAALDVLRWDAFVGGGRIQVTVERGHVTLEGSVATQHEKDQAEVVVRRLKGVADVANRIRVNPNVSGTDVKHRITEALRRSAELEARRIHVSVDGGRVVLEGCLNDWSEVDAARRAAAAVPGVTDIDSRLTVAP